MAGRSPLDEFVHQDQDLTRRVGAEVLKQFPEVQFAFSYGSAVMSQDGNKPKIATTKSSLRESKMMDFIFVVADPEVWHRRNLRHFPEHYSFLKRFGPKMIEKIQSFGAGMYFNPYATVPITDASLANEMGLSNQKQPELLIKYGVISTEDAMKDLLFWDNLYLSGRLHKPVTILKNNPIFKTAMDYNLHHALSLSILLLPERFSEMDLFSTICSISYHGDIRMGVAEDPEKIRKIVKGSLPHFRALYGPLLHHYIESSTLPFYSTNSPQAINYNKTGTTELINAVINTDSNSLHLRRLNDPTLRSRLITSLPLGLRKIAASAREPRTTITPEGKVSKSFFFTQPASLLPIVSKSYYRASQMYPFMFPGDNEDPVKWDKTLEVALAPKFSSKYATFLTHFPIFHEIFHQSIPQSPKIPIPPATPEELANDLIVKPGSVSRLTDNELSHSGLPPVLKAREKFQNDLKNAQEATDEKSVAASSSVVQKMITSLLTLKSNNIRVGSLAKNIDAYKPYIPFVEEVEYYGKNGLLTRKKFDRYYEAVKKQHSIELANNLQASTAKIVQKSSRAQTFKGMWSAGVTKSVVYAVSKLLKAGVRRG